MRRPLAVAVVSAWVFLTAQPPLVLASCNPGRPPASNAWQAGAYKFNIEPWGVRAYLEGYDPYVPYLSPGTVASVTIMMARGTSYYIQPGWIESRNVTGWPNGIHSFVQFRDVTTFRTDFFGSDIFVGQPDPVPAPGTLGERYKIVKSLGTSGLFELDVQFAGVCCWTYTTAFVYTSVQIFGEILNEATQFPGGVNDHVRLRQVEWKNPNLVWKNVNVNTPTSISELGWTHPDWDAYDIWDKACPT